MGPDLDGNFWTKVHGMVLQKRIKGTLELNRPIL
jgi:hypothetical protein